MKRSLRTNLSLAAGLVSLLAAGAALSNESFDKTGDIEAYGMRRCFAEFQAKDARSRPSKKQLANKPRIFAAALQDAHEKGADGFTTPGRVGKYSSFLATSNFGSHHFPTPFHAHIDDSARRYAPNAIGKTLEDRSQAKVIIDDRFDDGDLSTNRKGIGNGWGVRGHRLPQGPGSLIEADGHATFTVARQHGSMWLWSRPEDELEIMTPEPVSITWEIDRTVIQTKHKFEKDWAFHWNLGVVASHKPNSYWAHPPKMRGQGGLFINIGQSDGERESKFHIYIADDTADMSLAGASSTCFRTQF